MPDDDPLVEEEHIPAAPAEARADFENRALPQAFEFTGEDALRLLSTSMTDLTRIGIHLRMRRPDGQSIGARHTTTVAVDAQISYREIECGAGHLQNVTLFVDNLGTPYGDCYVQLQVIRGRGASAIVLGTILQGFISEFRHLAWPGSPLHSAIEGPPRTRIVFGVNPGAGNSFIETVPSLVTWELLTISALLQADGTVGSRTCALRVYWPFDGSGTWLFSIAQDYAITAGQSNRYGWGVGLSWAPSPPSSGRITPLPAGIELPGDTVIQLLSFGGGGGDEWFSPRLLVRERMEVP